MQIPIRQNSRSPIRAILELLRDLDVRTSTRPGAGEEAWRMALLAVLAARHLEHPVDLGRTLEMIAVQALGMPADAVRDRLDRDNGLHLSALLLELENMGTSEAKLVNDVRRLVGGGSATACSRDRFLRALAAG